MTAPKLRLILRRAATFPAWRLSVLARGALPALLLAALFAGFGAQTAHAQQLNFVPGPDAAYTWPVGEEIAQVRIAVNITGGPSTNVGVAVTGLPPGIRAETTSTGFTTFLRGTPTMPGTYEARITVTGPPPIVPLIMDFTITIEEAPATPTIAAAGAYAVLEDAGVNTNVGAALTASDFPDATTDEPTTWSITAGNTGNAFSITGAGQIQVADALDRSVTATYSLTVQLEQGGATATATVSITVVPQAVVSVSGTSDCGSTNTPASGICRLEADVNMDFVVTLDRDLVGTETATLDYRVSSDNAADGVHYMASSGTLNFDASNRSRTVSVPLLDDDLVNVDLIRNLFLQLTNPSANLDLPSSAFTTRGRMVDTEILRLGLVGNPPEGREGETLTGRVEVTEGEMEEGLDVVVAYGTQDNTFLPEGERATAGADYTAVNRFLPANRFTFNADNTVRTFQVMLTADDIDEGRESFFLRVALAAPQDNVVLSPISLAAFINDPATITGDLAGAVTEDATSPGDTATGTLTATNLASADVAPQTDAAGTYGAFTIAAGGAWTYTLDNGNSDTNALAAGASVTDTFTVVAADDSTVTADVIITVTGANDAPTADAGMDQAVGPGAGVTLDGSGSSDPDTADAIETWTWSQTSPSTPTVDFSADDTSNATFAFTAPTVTTSTDFVFSLVVNDGAANSAADTVTVTVEPTGPPVSVAIDSPIAGDDFVNRGEWVAGFEITGTTEAGATVSVTLDGGTARDATVNGTTWTLAIGTQDTQLFDIREGDVAVAATAMLSGKTAGTASDSFALDLFPPLAAWAVPTSLIVGVPIATITPTHTETDITGYAVQSGSLPPGLNLSAASGAISGTPTTANSVAATVTIRVTDDAGNTRDVTVAFPAVSPAGTVCVDAAHPADDDLCLETPDDLSLTAGDPLPGPSGLILLPTASGGDEGTYTYALTPTLSAGLTFASSSGISPRIQGIPTAAQAATDYTYTATDDAGAAVSVTFTITVAAAAPSLSFPAGTDFSVLFGIAETASVGTNVGQPPIVANFPAGAPTWSITAGNTGAAFTISNTGQISTATPLDFETTASYDLTIQLTQGGATATTDVTVTVRDVSEPPVAVGTIDPVSVSSDDDPVEVDIATDFREGDGGALTYTAASDDTAVATANVSGSTVTITPVAAGDATVTVTAADPDGLRATQEIDVTVTASADATLSALTISAGTLTPVFASGTTGYTASVGNSVTSLTVTPTAASANASISVNDDDVNSGMASGEISLGEGTNTVRIVVTAEDGAATQTYMVTVTRSTSVTFTQAPQSSYSFPAGAGAVNQPLYMLSSGDPGRTPTFNPGLPAGITWSGTVSLNRDVSLINRRDNLGNIIPTTPGVYGPITMTIMGTSLTAEFTITITGNAGSTPTVTASGTYEVPEDAAVDTDVGAALTASNFPGSGGSWSISDGNAGNAFKITDSGRIQVAAALDHETAPSYDLAVRFAQGGVSNTARVTVTVTDVNEAPEAAASIRAVTAEAGGDAVTRDVASGFNDPDDGDTLSYSAASDDTAVATVSVSGSTVSITPVAAGSATVTVTATDPDGLTATQDIDVTVNPAGGGPDGGTNRPPPAPRVTNQDAITNVPFTYQFAEVTDPDDGDMVLYDHHCPADANAAPLVTGTCPGGWLRFDDATRTFSGTPMIDHVGSFAVTVIASDDDGSFSFAVFTITVAGPSLSARGPYRVAEDAPVGTNVGAPVAAIGFPGSGGMWSITNGNTGGAFSIDGDGQISTAAELDRETTPRYTLTVQFVQGGVTDEIMVTVTVVDGIVELQARSGRVAEAVLPHVAQAVTASALSAITGRIDAAAGAAPQGVSGLAGKASLLQALKANERGLEDGTIDLARALGGSSFVMPLNASGGGGSSRIGDIAVWGSGDWRRLSGPDDRMVDWDGDMFSFHLGADMRVRSDLLAGVSVSRSSGSFDYTDRGGAEPPVKGSYDSDMTGVHPYANWSPAKGSSLWATVGWGRGEIEIDEEGGERRSSDTEMKSAAAGGSHVLASDDGLVPGGTATLRLKGEGALARIDVEGGDAIRPVEFDVRRLRVALEGALECIPGGAGGCLTPSVEAGLRHDGGDARTGIGVEVGGGLRWTDRTMGLTLEFRGRALVVDGDDHEDWGVGGLFRLDPGASGRGLSLRLSPGFGDSTGDVESLYDHGAFGAADGNATPSGRLDAEIGYGFAAGGGEGLLTPYAGLSLAEEGKRDWRLGGRFALGPSFRLSLEGTRRESATADPDHGIMARGRLNW